MNRLLTRAIEKSTPKFNKNVTEGTGHILLPQVPEYLNEIFKSGINSLSPKVPLKYLGLRRMLPSEEFKLNTHNKDSGFTHDLAFNYIYPISLEFEYDGVPIQRKLYLLYADRGNIITLSGSKYSIIPVLSDTVISPTSTELFIRLLKNKLTYQIKSRNFIVDGEKTPGDLIYSEILKTAANQVTDNIGKPIPVVSLYLAANKGAIGALKYYAGANDVKILTGNVDKYRDDYHVYESTKISPRGLKFTGYTGHDVKFLIDKNTKDTQLASNIIFGLIYSLEILPNHVNDFMTIVNEELTEDEKFFWKIMQSRIAYKNSFSMDRMTTDSSMHYDELNGYIDSQTSKKMKDLGYVVNNFFDLNALILKNFRYWISNSNAYNGDMDNRYIDYIYYTHYSIIEGFNRAIRTITRRSNKNTPSLNEVRKVLSNELSPIKILSLTKSREPNLAISGTDYSGDIMYPKITSSLEDQSRGSGVNRNKKNPFPESAKSLHAGDCGAGSLLYLRKKLPSPRFRINPYLNYDVGTGKIQHPAEIKEHINHLDNELK